MITDFWLQKYKKDAEKSWNLFYKRNDRRFFKDRYWTESEFGELFSSSNDQITLLEVGCGVGNFFYPFIERHKNVFVYACDFSEHAVKLVKV